MSSTSSQPQSATGLPLLDIVGVGIEIEMLPQSDVVKALSMGEKASLLPLDSDAYPESAAGRRSDFEKRCASTLKSAAKHFVEGWPIPTISIWPERGVNTNKLADEEGKAYLMQQLDMLRKSAGMAQHLFLGLPPRFDHRSERILDLIFRAFDQSPDLPALLLLASDGEIVRQLVGDTSRKKYWSDSPRQFGSMAETSVALLFVCRERVDTHIRPFVGSGGTHIYEPSATKPGFRSTRFLQQCWDAKQLNQFDRIPTIASVSRPTNVSYSRDQSESPSVATERSQKLLTPQKRNDIFEKTFEHALSALEGKEPSKILFDTGGAETGSHVIPLSQAMLAQLPDMDLFDPEEGCNISQRIGNLGIASPFAMLAIGALLSNENRNAILSVNLRHADSANMSAILPPPQIPSRSNGAAKAQQAMQAPSTTAVPPNPFVALGTRIQSGDECPQSGMWRSDPADAQSGNANHYFLSGRAMPKVTILRKLTTVQKLRGEPQYQTVPAFWTLVTYDMPHSANAG